jgi:hypothetical protein
MSTEPQQATVTIACQVALGMFRDERGVEIQLPEGPVAALVDKNDVCVEREPAPGQSVPGHLRVSVIEVGGDTVIVDLPRPSFAAGQRLRVPRRLLEGIPA